MLSIVVCRIAVIDRRQFDWDSYYLHRNIFFRLLFLYYVLQSMAISHDCFATFISVSEHFVFLSRPISGVDGSKTLGFCFATRLSFKILYFESHAASQWADIIILWLFWLRRNARSAIVNRIRFLIEKDLCVARREIILLLSYLVKQHTLVTGHRTLPWCDSFSS